VCRPCFKQCLSRWFPVGDAEDALSQASSRRVHLGAGVSDEPTVVHELLDAREVAALLKVRSKRVYELGIPSVRVGPRTLRWRVSDVEAWLIERRSAA
jgi:predicted DNA-binding transcriptional regulator AlpA